MATTEQGSTIPISPNVGQGRQIGIFARHYGEMCIPMCVGFAVGDLL